MASMSDLLAEHAELDEAEQQWLRMVVSEWQVLADLSFSDLVLWVPDVDVNVYRAVAQIRPTTGPTALLDDVVGDVIAYAPEHLVSEAFMSEKITKTSSSRLGAGLPVETHAIPVVFGGRSIAVVEQHTSLLGLREPSALERAYLDSAADLAEMVSTAAFPVAGDPFDPSINPRVGDGFIRLDADGDVVYASPNALSAYRRLGLIGVTWSTSTWPP